MMDLVIATSDMAMRSVVNRINDLKLTDFDGENVLLFSSYIRGAVLLLKNHDAMTQLVYKGLKTCACSEFVDFITAMQNNDKLGLKSSTLGTDETLKKAEKEYTELIGRKEWDAKSIKVNQESTYVAHTEQSPETCVIIVGR